MPTTRLGRLAVGLGLLALATVGLISIIGAFPLLPILMSAVAGILALVSIMAKGERSALAFMALPLPLMVALILTMAAA